MMGVGDSALMMMMEMMALTEMEDDEGVCPVGAVWGTPLAAGAGILYAGRVLVGTCVAG